METCRKYLARAAEIREPKGNDINEEVKKIRDAQPSGNGRRRFYLGSGSDEAEEGVWVWASDAQRFYHHKQKGISGAIPGQYNNFVIDDVTSIYLDEDANCLIMDYKGDWKSLSCDIQEWVLCEARPLTAVTVPLNDLFDSKFERE